MKLPERNTQVGTRELIILAAANGKMDIVNILRDDPPMSIFISDGCSKFPDVWGDDDLYPACFWHDVRYWAGRAGDELGRLKADAALLVDVAEIAGVEIAHLMFEGVRVGGTERFKTSFRWGYGR